MGSLQISSSVTVDVPPALAWSVVADFARNPEWQRGMKTAEWVTKPPLAVGSRYVQHAGFLGRDIRSLFEVVELEPGRLVTIDTIEGTFPITVTRTVIPADGGCLISADVRGDAGGLFRLMTPLLRALVKRSVDGDYRRLKRLLESTAGPTD
jgi:carbon monoxide dehydrogenase subunit G